MCASSAEACVPRVLSLSQLYKQLWFWKSNNKSESRASDGSRL